MYRTIGYSPSIMLLRFSDSLPATFTSSSAAARSSVCTTESIGGSEGLKSRDSSRSMKERRLDCTGKQSDVSRTIGAIEFVDSKTKGSGSRFLDPRLGASRHRQAAPFRYRDQACGREAQRSKESRVAKAAKVSWGPQYDAGRLCHAVAGPSTGGWSKT